MNYVLCDYIYRGEHDLVNGRDDRKEFNPRIGWRNGNWNLSIWGKNLTDDEYASMIYNAQKWGGKLSPSASTTENLWHSRCAL